MTVRRAAIEEMDAGGDGNSDKYWSNENEKWSMWIIWSKWGGESVELPVFAVVFSNLYPIFVPYTKNTRYNMPNETINRIKVVLAEQNKTNKWLAGELGITQATVSRWGRNRTQPSLEKLVEIARLLNVEVKDLINKESQIKQFREDEE